LSKNLEEPVVPVLVAALDPSCNNATLVFAKRLRQAGIGCITDTRGKKIKKVYDWAISLRCFYVVFIGSNEIAAGVVAVKDLDEKTQESMVPEAAVELIASMVLTPEELLAVRLRRVIDEDVHARNALENNLFDAPPRGPTEAGPESGTV
jgi:hypothetical protein